MVGLTWSELASYQYGVFRAQKSHNAHSRVPVFKSCKMKSHTLENRYKLRPRWLPLEPRLSGDGACLINSFEGKLLQEKSKHTLWLSVCLSASVHMSSSRPLRLLLPSSLLCSLSLSSWCGSVCVSVCVSLQARWGFGPIKLRALSRARDSTERYALLGEGLTNQSFFQAPPVRARRQDRVWLMTSSSLATSVNISAYQLHWLSLERRERKIKIATQRQIVEQQNSQEGASGKSSDSNKFYNLPLH